MACFIFLYPARETVKLYSAQLDIPGAVLEEPTNNHFASIANVQLPYIVPFHRGQSGDL